MMLFERSKGDIFRIKYESNAVRIEQCLPYGKTGLEKTNHPPRPTDHQADKLEEQSNERHKSCTGNATPLSKLNSSGKIAERDGQREPEYGSSYL